MQLKTIIYARVSSREQEDTGYSLDAQEKLLKEYADKKELKVAKIFKITESASGKQIRRIFIEMFQYAEKQGVKIILCEKIDRLTRNLKDAAIVNDWIQADASREIHFVKENFVVNRNTRAHENLVWDMKVAIARFYTNNLSEEVKKGQKEKISQGWLPTKPPIGYKTVGEKGHKIHVIDNPAASYVRKAFEYYATGNYSLAAIREKLYEEGLRTRAGGRLAKSRMESIVKDPFYYGAMRWNDAVYSGRHEPLISQELFDKVQSILTRKKAPHYKSHDFMFRKLMTCGECGGTITGEIQKGIIYYHCNHYRDCTQKAYTPEKTVESQILGVFKFFEAITPEEADEIKSKIRQNHAQEIEYKEKALDGLNQRYKALQRRLDVLYDDRLDGRIPVEIWELKNKEIVEEQTEIQNQIKKMKTEEAKYFEIWLNILDLARRAREIYEKRSPAEKRLLLQYIFSNLMLKDKNLMYSLSKPMEVLARRVQEKLDAEKHFRTMKKGSTKQQAAHAMDGLQPLLRG